MEYVIVCCIVKNCCQTPSTEQYSDNVAFSIKAPYLGKHRVMCDVETCYV